MAAFERIPFCQVQPGMIVLIPGDGEVNPPHTLAVRNRVILEGFGSEDSDEYPMVESTSRGYYSEHADRMVEVLGTFVTLHKDHYATR